ncbi:hypothetical protein CPB83DRAFT_609436 [Crepidotus variabilis]|uniref:Fungal-type protein kinase domain-containing protein n=1 Tax=Crepidotus variabilis TaxID=179855 RepID=A0A9P6JL32_9AGAR|nr:hypothetical protein CPB83DRAFT_609436 [Crepidotus variabilis]
MIYKEVVPRFDTPLVDSCQKYRLGLREIGIPSMKSKTPRIVLSVIYDLPETTRYLYTRHSVIHRDISKNNVLIIDEDSLKAYSSAAPSVEPSGSKFPRQVFIREILTPTSDAPPTLSLLIDMDCAEIINQKNDKPKEGKSGTQSSCQERFRTTG